MIPISLSQQVVSSLHSIQKVRPDEGRGVSTCSHVLLLYEGCVHMFSVRVVSTCSGVCSHVLCEGCVHMFSPSVRVVSTRSHVILCEGCVHMFSSSVRVVSTRSHVRDVSTCSPPL